MEPRIDGPISLFGMGRSGFLQRSTLRVRRVLGGGREGGSHCGYGWTRQTGIPCERWKMCSKASRITLRWKKSTHSFQSDSDCLFKLTDGEEGKVRSRRFVGRLCWLLRRRLEWGSHGSRKAITAKLSGSEKKNLKKHRDYLRGLENRREE